MMPSLLQGEAGTAASHDLCHQLVGSCYDLTSRAGYTLTYLLRISHLRSLTEGFSGNFTTQFGAAPLCWHKALFGLSLNIFDAGIDALRCR